jgi:hypothetical protein
MSGAEFESLKADIAANGLRQPVVMHDGLILDGGNRYHACVEIGVVPETVEFTGNNLAAYVMSVNFHRRHLSPGQQAAIVASAQDWQRAQRPGGDGSNQHAAKESGNVAGLQTVADRVAQSGASDRTQRMADKVAKESPELARQVAHGEISLPKALESLAPKIPAQSAPTTSPVPATLPDSLAALPVCAENDEQSEQVDDTPDFMAELRESEKEIAALNGEIERLNKLVEVMKKDDLAAEVAGWSLRYDQLKGLLELRNREYVAANADAVRYNAILAKLRKATGVEKNSDIIRHITPQSKA